MPTTSDIGAMIVPTLLGLCLGALAGMAVPTPAAVDAPPATVPPTPSSPRATAPRPGPAAAPCPDLAAEQLSRLDAAWATLDAAEDAKRAAEEPVRDVLGDPPGFEGFPAALRPGRVEDTVAELLDPDVAELQWVDCSDAPCIAVLRLVGDETDTVEAMRAAADPLRDELGSTASWEWFGVGGTDEHYMTVPLGPPELPDTVHHRTDLREEIIIDEFAAAGLAQ